MPKRAAIFRAYEGSRPKDDRRPNSAGRGYDHQWRKARLQHLRQNPLCVECLKRGETVAAALVDHIVPHRGDRELFWDTDNWQSLCVRHHTEKTASGQ